MRFPFRHFVLSATVCAVCFSAQAQVPIVPGDVLVMLRPGASAHKIAADLGAVQGIPTGVHVTREVSAPMRAWLFQFDTSAISQREMLRGFWGHPGVQLAQNNHIIAERNTPDDPELTQQWWHQNIQSELAWDITTGGVTATGDTIVVAIIEKADLTHPDLAANAWINYHEVPDNDLDDDGNGYVDDVRGWNPANGNDNVYSGSHGTQVAGMIGAVGNNGTQVVGANWHVKMMPVDYANTQEANVIASYTYPLVMRRLYNSTGGTKGAFVVATNASWGVDGGQPSEAPLWCAMYDTLGTAGVLNCGSTTNNNVDVDEVGDLPTACPSDFMISVTATNSDDMRTFSGWGATTVDLGAPGANVLTTTIGGGTGTTSGTSFASPLTAGVIALLYSVPCPSLAALAHNDPMEAALRVRQALLDGVDQAGNLPGNTVTGGRLNSFNSVQLLMDSCEACPAPYNMAISSDAIGSATVSWSALPGTYTLRYRAQGTTDWTVATGINGLDQTLSGLATCQAYEFQLASDCGDGLGAYGPTFTWTSEGCCTAPITITATAIDTTSASVTWATVLASSSYDLRYREVGATTWTELDNLSGNETTLTGLSSCSDLEMQMRSMCGGTTADWSASSTVHIPGCGHCLEGVFCTSEGDDGYEWLAGVHLASIDRTSQDDGGYADVNITEQSTVLQIGGSYPITLTPGYAFNTFPEYFTVWIDLDRNGEFTGSELVFDAGETVTSTLTDTLTVPDDATPGPTRLRVVMSYDDPVPNGCTPYDFGETEDYCINLTTTTIGIAETASEPSVALFPQPANELVNFLFGNPVQGQLTLTDIAGRHLAEWPVHGKHLAVPTAHLDDGLYAYTLHADGRVLARGRFLVVH